MQAERRTVTRTRHELVLPSPCHWTEVAKAFDYANHSTETYAVAADVQVEARDDEIVIWWEEASS